MIYYHGTDIRDWTIYKHQSSRYGMPAIFLSTGPTLANLYATYHARQRGLDHGYLYQCELRTDNLPKVQVNNISTYTADFRNLIHKLHKSGGKAYLINGVWDYPCTDLRTAHRDSIVCVFNLKMVINIKPTKI